MTDVFSNIYENNLWNNKESRSGPGSTFKATALIRPKIVDLIMDLEIRSILDIPCGDYHWMPTLGLQGYIGADVVPEMIEKNREEYPGVDFRVIDATTDRIPDVDLIFCRELLQHLSEENAKKAIQNFVNSEARYLLITSHDTRKKVKDIKDGEYAPRDLLQPPFNMPWPLEAFRDVGIKLMFLYDLDTLR